MQNGGKNTGKFSINEKELSKQYDSDLKEMYDRTDGELTFADEYEFYSKYQNGTANKDNFFYNTMAEFEPVKRRPSRKPDYVSYGRDGKVSSEYWYSEDGVIRGSSHWGRGVASCDWLLKGYTDSGRFSQTSKLYGKAAFSDFVYKSGFADINGKTVLKGFANVVNRGNVIVDGKEYFYNSYDKAWIDTGGRFSLAETDSDGRKLTDQQKEYFKNSKVRDEDGNLLVVYHGTSENFTIFDKTKTRSKMDIQGMFFSPWELDAQGYGENVKAYYLNITNPASGNIAYKALNKFSGQDNAGIKAREYLIDLGYDGVNNSDEEYIAFHSNQIKLADNTSPTNDKDIRFSLAENIDNYTEKDYNKYGWAYVNKVLTNTEARNFFNKIAELLTGTKFNTDIYGDYIIPVGEKFGVNNVLIFTDGNFDKPSIEKIIKIDLDNETDIEIVRDFIYGEARNSTLSNTAFKDFYGEQYFSVYTRHDFQSFSELRESGRTGKATDTDSEGQQNGGRNTRKNQGLFSYKENEDLIRKNEELREQNKSMRSTLKMVSHMLTVDGIDNNEDLPWIKSELSPYSKNNIKTLMDGVIRRYKADDVYKQDVYIRANNIYDHLLRTGDAEAAHNAFAQLVTDIVSKSKIKDSTEQYEAVKRLRQVMRGNRFRLNRDVQEHVISDYGSWSNFRKASWRLSIVKYETDPDAPQLDNLLWADIVGSFPEFFTPDDVDMTDTEQIDKLLDVINDDHLMLYYQGIGKAEISDVAAMEAAELVANVSKISPTFKDVKKYRQRVEDAERAVEDMKRQQQKIINERVKEKSRREAERLREADRRERIEFKRAYTERKETFEYRRKIQRVADSFEKTLLDPKEGKFIPAELVHSVMDLAAYVNSSEAVERFHTEKYNKAIEKLERELAETSDAAERERLQSEISKRVAWRDRYTRHLNEVKRAYNALANDSRYSNAYDEDVAAQLGEVFEEIGFKDFYELNSYELRRLYEVMKAVQHTVSNANKLFLSDRDIGAHEMGTGMIKETHNAKKHSRVRQLLKKIPNLQLDARRMFRQFSGYAVNGNWEQFYDLQDKAQLYQRQIEMESYDIFSELTNGKENVKNFEKLRKYGKDDLVDIGLKDRDTGESVPVTRGMMLSIAMALRNEDNLKHIMQGGYTVPDMRLYYKHSKEAWGVGSVRAVTDDIVAMSGKINEQLTEYEKLFMEKTKYYYDEYSRKVLNKTTLEMYGFEKAGVKNYFPINTDTDFVATWAESVKKDGRVENSGFMQKRKSAGNPIWLLDITEVVEKSINDTARYAALVPATKNWSKVMNTVSGDYGTSVKKELSQTFGESAVKYLDDLFGDINGNKRGNPGLFEKLRSHAAAAALTGNISVMMKQAASYPVASVELDFPSLMKGLKAVPGAFFNNKKRMEAISKYTPLLWYRNKGNSTEELGDLKASKAKKIIHNKVFDIYLNGIQKVDVATVTTLWTASEEYVKRHHGDLTVGSEEFYKKTAEYFNRVVERTQPNYTVLQRPEALRNGGNSFLKFFTMFKTQTFQNFGILYDAVADYNTQVHRYINDKGNEELRNNKKAAGSKLASAVTSQIVSSAVLVGMTLVARGFLHNMNPYRDDDDEITKESMSEQLIKDFIGTYTGMVIGGSELFDLINSIVTKDTYYGVDITGISGIQDSADGIKKLVDAATKYAEENDEENKKKLKGTLKNRVMSLTGNLMQVLGIPFTTVKNQVEGLIEHATDIKNHEFLSFEAGTGRTDGTQYNRLYEAITAGDTEKYKTVYNELTESGKTDEQIQNKIKSMLIENDPNILELARKYINDNLVAYKNGIAEYKQGGYERDTAAKAIQDIVNNVKTAAQAKIDNDTVKYEDTVKKLVKLGYSEADIEKDIEKFLLDESEESNNYYSIFKAEDLATAYLEHNTSLYNEIFEELSKKKKDPDNAADQVFNDLKDAMKTLYAFGKISENTVEQFMKDYAEEFKLIDTKDKDEDGDKTDIDENELYWKLEEWNHYAEGDKDWSKYSDYYVAIDAYIESGGQGSGATTARQQMQAYIDNAYKHGVQKKDIAAKITTRYKEMYLELMKRDKTAAALLKQNLLVCYYMLGYDWNYYNKKINNWSE